MSGHPYGDTIPQSKLILEERVVAFAPLALDQGVSLVVEAPQTAVTLDRTRTRQALDNLVENALRHTPPGGTIRILAEARDGVVELAVEDDGSGFTSGALASAFEPFNTGTDEGVAGLGLAMANAIAVAHGGTATAENRREGGARVTLRMPSVV